MFVDEDVAHIEHVLQVVSIFTLLAIVSRCVEMYFFFFKNIKQFKRDSIYFAILNKMFDTR